MGEMVMKKYFDKENFVSSTFDYRMKKQSLFISIALIVLFIFSAFTFLNALYAFADAIGSIVSGSADAALRDALRSLPLFLSCFMSIWGLLLFHGLFRNVSDERRVKSIKKNAYALIGFAIVNFIAVLVMRFIGKFHSLVEGSPSPLYPLDSILYSLVFVGIAVFAILYLKKFQEKIPFVSPSRGPIVTKVRGLYCTFMSFWMLIALFSFATFTLGLFIHDFDNSYVFYSVCLMLVFFINFIFIGVWEFYYNELKEEKKRELLFGLALAGLVVSVLTVALYFVSLGLNLDGPSNAGFGVLPVAFAASVNIATMIVVFTPLIVSVTALIKVLVARKK